ncbi:ABC transporter permease [Lihuaxuella thermophila]|uniref:ABC-type transport system, involved in lipoprotein release, permease component n=1 Tax=Lihuaxuella thermophila TaxID=1173111 RepID=A0A1H8CEM2_9BACL|nr:ABC transporter permease [Lihuaxuella thermophila]SEM92547.1 ABC-type transport system, involved in lipoprotein release, permease component [Lihuaxuella thermophila]
MNLWKISFRPWIRHKWRTIFTMISIVLGTALMTSMMTSVQATQTAVRAKLEQEPPRLTIKGNNFVFSEDLVSLVRQSVGPDVRVKARLDYTVQVQLSHRPSPKEETDSLKVRLHGFVSPAEELRPFRMQDGDSRGQGLWIDQKTARLWKVQAGDTVLFMVKGKPQPIRVTAVVNQTPELSNPDHWEEANDQVWNVALPLSTLQRWTDNGGKISAIEITPPRDEIPAFKKRLNDALSRYPVYVEQDIKDELDLARGMDEIFQGLQAVGFLGIALGTLILYGTYHASVAERRSEFAVMKAVGFTSRQIVVWLLREIMIFALMGVPIGVLLGAVSSRWIAQELDRIFDLRTPVPPDWFPSLLIAGCASLIAVVLATLVPLFHAAKTKCGHYGEARGSNKRSLPLQWLFKILSLFPAVMKWVFLAVSLIASKLLGYEGELAKRYTLSNPSRIALPAGLICVTVACMVVTVHIEAAAERNIHVSSRPLLGGDLAFSLYEPAGAEELSQMSRWPGIQKWSAYREMKAAAWMDRKSRDVLVISSPDPEWKLPLFVPDQPGGEIRDRMKKPNAILLGQTLYREWGGKTGDFIWIETPKGKRPFQVVGQVYTLRGKGNAAFVSDDSFVQTFGSHDVRHVVIQKAPSADISRIKQQVIDTYSERLFSVQTLDGFIEHRLEATRHPLKLFRLLLGAIWIVAGLGLLNAIWVSVLERSEEIRWMKLIAFTPKQVRNTIIAEGFIIGMSGTLAGITLGFLLVPAAMAGADIIGVREAGPMPFSSLLLIAVFGLIISFLASFPPAAKAARISVAHVHQQD